MNIGFTGTKHGMTLPQTETIRALLGLFYAAINTTMYPSESYTPEFHHGDCIGADFESAGIAKSMKYKLICHPPVNPSKRAWSDFNDTVMPEYDYIVRDQHIVNDSRILIAAPHTSYEVTRSGTWTTVRYARKQKRNIFIVNPDGTVTHEDHTHDA